MRLHAYGSDRRFVAKLFPRSMAAEQYRVAAARLQLSSGGAGVAVVTSAIKGEGKTTTVINLGYTLARDFGKRVLLVDCDFVYPELKCFLERPTQYGLIDYLRGDSDSMMRWHLSPKFHVGSCRLECPRPIQPSC